MVAGFSGNGKAQVHVLRQVNSLLAERRLDLKTELVETPLSAAPVLDVLLVQNASACAIHTQVTSTCGSEMIAEPQAETFRRLRTDLAGRARNCVHELIVGGVVFDVGADVERQIWPQMPADSGA